MWESSIYKFEEETSSNGEAVTQQFTINVTYSAPRNLDDPGKALIGIFNKMTAGRKPSDIKILDVGAAKLRNTLWLLQKGYQVWAVEFPELRDRLEDAREKWEKAEKYPNFHSVTFPSDFINLKEKFDFILLINVINVMPIPSERFVLLSLCREKLKDDGKLLWHHWRGLTSSPKEYTEENAFIDGYLKGKSPNHSFYVEYSSPMTHEILYSVGFSVDENAKLHNIPGNSSYSYLYLPTHNQLVANALDLKRVVNKPRDPNRIIPTPNRLHVLDLYLNELNKIKPGRRGAHSYHLVASRIFGQIFSNQLDYPIVEQEINEGRGRIDIAYKNLNREGIFKNVKELRDIRCPQIIVECKNYTDELENPEYSQLNDRLSSNRGMLGFLLCRKKIDEQKVIKHCKDRYKHNDNKKFIIVLDDEDLIRLGRFKVESETDYEINNYIDNKIIEIID